MNDSQSRQLQALIENYANAFSDVPGRTSKIEHKINLVDKEPVHLKPYPLPYALWQELKDEIREMLDMGVIRKSSSPYASPVVIVKKKDYGVVALRFESHLHLLQQINKSDDCGSRANEDIGESLPTVEEVEILLEDQSQQRILADTRSRRCIQDCVCDTGQDI